MSLEDPFFVVKDEVQKAVQNAKGLYQRWCELLADSGNCSKEEYEWTTKELRNSLRSIEWDLEDLEETISIVEKNPRKFKIDDSELGDRRGFVERTKCSIKEMKEHLASPQNRNQGLDRASGQLPVEPESHQVARIRLVGGKAKPGMTVYGSANGPSKPQDRYTRLENEVERANSKFIDDSNSQQQLMVEAQDDQLEAMGSSVGVLKNMSRQIGSELDEQAVMLDDFAHEMDTTETKMDNVMKKMAKVLHMSNDKRQWIAIGVLLVIMLVVIILLSVL